MQKELIDTQFLRAAQSMCTKVKLEDLKVLRRSPDLLNNVKLGQGQQQLIMEQIFVLPYMGVADILVK